MVWLEEIGASSLNHSAVMQNCLVSLRKFRLDSNYPIENTYVSQEQFVLLHSLFTILYRQTYIHSHTHTHPPTHTHKQKKAVCSF